MTLSVLLWLALAAYSVHVLEEYALDWRLWAQNVLRLPAEWGDFYIANSVVVVLGIVSASIAGRAPGWSLAFPALMLINATFFHVLPFVIKRGRFSPGLITALLLFYPTALLCYRRAWQEGLLDGHSLALSFAIGALVMATPIVLLKIKDRPYFRQDRPASSRV